MRNHKRHIGTKPPAEEHHYCRKCKQIKPVLTGFKYLVNQYGKKIIAESCLTCGGDVAGDGFDLPYREGRTPQRERGTRARKKVKEGYEEGGIGWIISKLLHACEQRTLCKVMALKTKQKHYWTGFYTESRKVEGYTNELIEKFGKVAYNGN